APPCWALRTAVRPPRRESRAVSLDCDALYLEAGPEQERARAEEGARREALGEVAPIHVVERTEEGHVGAEDLERDEVVHGHAFLREHALDLVHHVASFGGGVGGGLVGRGVEADPSRQVQRLAHQDRVAVRTGARPVLQPDVTAVLGRKRLHVPPPRRHGITDGWNYPPD